MLVEATKHKAICCCAGNPEFMCVQMYYFVINLYNPESQHLFALRINKSSSDI